MKQMNYKFSLCLHAEALNKPSEIHIDTVKSLGGQVESSEIMETMETTEITKKQLNKEKITTFRHIHFYLIFDVSSVTTLIVKKLL